MHLGIVADQDGVEALGAEAVLRAGRIEIETEAAALEILDSRYVRGAYGAYTCRRR